VRGRRFDVDRDRDGSVDDPGNQADHHDAAGNHDNRPYALHHHPADDHA
jgi:hypothetical protein